MRITLAAVSPRRLRLKSGPSHELVQDYVARSARYSPTFLTFFETQTALLESRAGSGKRGAAYLVLLDSRGSSLSSVAIAQHLKKVRDGGKQEILFAVGPADGWSATTRGQCDLLLSLGAITLPHELALVVLGEQVYRAQTILAGHPYHCGHSACVKAEQSSRAHK